MDERIISFALIVLNCNKITKEPEQYYSIFVF